MTERVRSVSVQTVLAALAVSWLLVWGGWSLWVVSDEDQRGVMPPIVFSALDPEWQVASGDGGVTAQGLAMTEPGARGQSLLLLDLPTPLDTSQIARVTINLSEGRPANLGFEWSVIAGQYVPADTQPVRWLEDQRGEVDLSRAWRWQGEVYQLALADVGLVGGPWTLASIELHAPALGFWSLQRALWDRFYIKDDWRPSDVNTQRPGGFGLSVSVVPLVAAWVGLSVVLLCWWPFNRGALSTKSRGARVTMPMSMAMAVPLLVAWWVLDLRWQAELFHKAAHGIRAAAVNASTEPAFADFDVALTQFIERLHDETDRTQFDRAVVIGDVGWGTWLRYRLAAWGVRGVFSDTPQEGLATAMSVLQPGDLVLIQAGFGLEVVSRDAEVADTERVPVVLRSNDRRMRLDGYKHLHHPPYWAILITEQTEDAP